VQEGPKSAAAPSGKSLRTGARRMPSDSLSSAAIMEVSDRISEGAEKKMGIHTEERRLCVVGSRDRAREVSVLGGDRVSQQEPHRLLYGPCGYRT
jgi:hypothetical protein